MEYLWEWYKDMKGVEPLTFTEIRNWCELLYVRLKAWEVDVLKALDRIYWRVQSEH